MAQPSKKEILADPILRKGHAHKMKELTPEVCPDCFGKGVLEDGEECPTCQGLGVIYEV